MRSLRASHTEATSVAIARAGRRRFGRQGFEATSVEEIATDARVTTGAIYHHFAGKKGLFLAVAEQIEVELLAKAVAVRDEDPWRGLERAFVTLIDATAVPEIQRIIFLDAPRVIGQEAWRAIELKYGYGAMAGALSGLAEAGILRPYPVELMAPILLSLLAETSRAIATEPKHRDEAVDLVKRVLHSLRTE
jgi:AcrR family transcriptional regulator